MNGLELSRHLYEEIGHPVIERNFPCVLPLMATGLIGCNSQVYGYDDEVSRDHAWGPFFIVYLRDSIEPETIRAMEAKLHEAMPDSFKGVPLSAQRDTLFNMPDFMLTHARDAKRFLIGYPDLPPGDLAWMTIPENRLYEATRGEIFRDPSGLMTNWRASLAYFPENVWRKRVSFSWYALAAAAQLPRYVRRRDAVGAHLCISWLLEMSMRLYLLLHSTYAPWRKWLARECREVAPDDADFHDTIQALAREQHLERAEMLALQLLDHLGCLANAKGTIESQPLRVEHNATFLDFNFAGFWQAFLEGVTGDLRRLPLEAGPVDLWGPLHTMTSAPPRFLGNAVFINAIYEMNP